MEPESNIFLVIYREASTTSSNYPATNEWTQGMRCIDLIMNDGKHLEHQEHITIPIEQYVNIIKSILNLRHFHYIKQFTIRLFGNNLYFKSVTSKWTDSGTKCNSFKLLMKIEYTSSPAKYTKT